MITHYDAWIVIGYEAFYSSHHEGNPLKSHFDKNYLRNALNKRVTPYDRAWFWYRVGFRKAKCFDNKIRG